MPMISVNQQLCKTEIIRKSILIEDGNPARYRLQKKSDTLEQSKTYRKITFGKRDKQKPHRVILIVGETGTGKTTLINTMINYILDVKREDKVWFEITDDQSDQTSAHSQTSIITVYGFYLQESPIHLSIIDTPGYGDTRGIDLEQETAMSLLSLSESAEVHEIHAVCLVIKATQNRLSDSQIYIFDAVQSLFGRDVAENIVLFFTHSDGFLPKDALVAIKEADIKCAVNDKNQPVYFLFNNRQSDAADEEYKTIQEQSWNLSFRGMEGFFRIFDTKKPKSLKMTRHVLQQQKQLEAKIYNIRSRVHEMELKQNQLKQTTAALEQKKKQVENNTNFEYEVEVAYKEMVDIDNSLAKMATCCTVCEENCHYPGCWWVSDLSWCSSMKENFCTVCTNRCKYTEHIKGAKIFVAKTRIEKRTYEDLKKEYKDTIGVSLVEKLVEELEKLEKKKVKLVNDAFNCVERLQIIALNVNSLLTLKHIDFLIEKLKEINEPIKAEKLEDIKKRAGQGKLKALKLFFINHF